MPPERRLAAGSCHSCRCSGWSVGGVAEEGSGGVGPGGGSGPGDAVDHFDLPAVSVGDVDVVGRADQDEVVDVGGSVVGPGGDVVDFAEGAGGVAAGDDAADVSGVERGLLGGGGQAVAAAEVQDGAVFVQEGAAEASGAGEHGEHGGVDGAAV